jgi:hypothetical protein
MHKAPLQAVVAQMRHFLDSERPGFSLFLGAGASRSSGVPLAEELADFAIKAIFESDGNRIDPHTSPDVARGTIRTWEKSQLWWDESKSRYQLAMENALLAPGVRARFLKTHTGKARPSQGYRRLAQLLNSRVFDTVYTTNFDDLVRRGCEGVLEGSLVEVAAPEAFEEQLPSPCEPRVIRLHGDYWHGNVLNTEGELERTPGIRFETVYRLSRPQGMIVIGYGGQDRTVMLRLFQDHIRDKNFLKNGLFWCIRRGSDVPAHLRVVMDIDEEVKGNRVYVVEVDGFDEAVERLAAGFGLATDAFVLTESLRDVTEAQALLTDGAQLLVDTVPGEPALRDRFHDVFHRLAQRLEVREAALIAMSPDGGKVVAAVNKPVLVDLEIPARSLLLSCLSREEPFEVTVADLTKDDLFAPTADRRVVAYPVHCDGRPLGGAVFCFDRSTPQGDQNERVISVLCGLLILASQRMA